MKDMTTIPLRALILCADERLSRLLETELAYMGVTARTVHALPEADGEISLLVADGDGSDVLDCESYARACGCPLLVFGREARTLSYARGSFLRRPFALDRLEATVQDLLDSEAVLRAFPPYQTHEGDLHAPVAPAPLLTVQDGTVAVEGKPIPMTPAEWGIFECLYARRGSAVSREELSALLGGGGNSVEVYVCKLRTKLEKPLGRRMILTVRGVGYRMDI